MAEEHGGSWIDHDTIEALVPSDDPELFSDGLSKIHPGHPQWDVWAEWLEDSGYPRPNR